MQKLRIRRRALGQAILVVSTTSCLFTTIHSIDFSVKSGIRPWVDIDTPLDRQTFVSSRGDTWELVMSDEFNTPGRSFKAGEDHMWTSIEKPDGVNAALQVYSHNMTTTECDDHGNCYFQITAQEDTTTLRVWNDYQKVPGYKTTTFYYRSGMVQSWNKFCYQGGMLEVRAQLPGATTPESGNPDIAAGPTGLARTSQYYPTWPGVWMLGNLGRAIFSASNNRMWPFSYNKCEPDVFNPRNQRISACDKNPGHGLNPNQGRGAPEIDLIEGAGNEISTSIQVGPGMPAEYRTIPVKNEPYGCVFSSSCTTPGANTPDVPTAVYQTKREHKSWYQGLRYAANNFCASDPAKKQKYDAVSKAQKVGVKENACGLATCSASKDFHADLGFIDGKGSVRWGINENGTCFPVLNGYSGAYLCSPGNPSPSCDQSEGIPLNSKVTMFEYQMDAISANWPIHVGAYTDFVVFQVEWVMGSNGYVRWMLEGNPLYEIPASALENVPQNAQKSNPQKIMVEEPMSIIINVALSKTWGTQPPNAGKACRGDGSDPKTNKLCNAFPMHLKIDYIRVYQDVSEGSTMAVGCDPKTHPTRQWILDHIDEYQTWDNLAIDVHGKANCRDHADCTGGNGTVGKVLTGRCEKGRCVCSGAWTGPRCSSAMGALNGDDDVDGLGVMGRGYKTSDGPPWVVALSVAALCVCLTMLTIYYSIQQDRRNAMERQKQIQLQPKSTLSISSAAEGGMKEGGTMSNRNGNVQQRQVPPSNNQYRTNHGTNYATNFV